MESTHGATMSRPASCLHRNCNNPICLECGTRVDFGAVLAKLEKIQKAHKRWMDSDPPEPTKRHLGDTVFVHEVASILDGEM